MSDDVTDLADVLDLAEPALAPEPHVAAPVSATWTDQPGAEPTPATADVPEEYHELVGEVWKAADALVVALKAAADKLGPMLVTEPQLIAKAVSYGNPYRNADTVTPEELQRARAELSAAPEVVGSIALWGPQAGERGVSLSLSATATFSQRDQPG